ncbi:MAG: 23S rRNA (adenine(2503)-C(2))-methyltransferase RlmN [Flavobacteriales bacterium]|nr:MAG: 23S rRNA (adenine(2503)-C(2))-methyltransferase RlmN [Flavobacteriales bacterium]
MVSKKDIRALSLSEIENFFKENDEKPFRAKQVYEWLWKKSARSFAEMTNLSLGIRQLLEKNFTLRTISLAETQRSSDGTIKSVFKLHDGYIIEGVLIPTENRMTACISSQVGCSLTCKFCATGKMVRKRNLEVGEIYDQVVEISRQAEKNHAKPLSNIVYMGMGEPLLNYNNVLESAEKITSVNGLGISPKRITVSTAGISKMIKKLADDAAKFNLALSLHAANDEKRSHIMPINEQNSLASLKKALQYFHGKTGKRITFEYIIFNNFNDEIIDAEELVKFCEHLPCKVNIIEYNPIDDAEFSQAEKQKVDAFANFLKNKNIPSSIRRSRGKDIDAACGQLANKNSVITA